MAPTRVLFVHDRRQHLPLEVHVPHVDLDGSCDETEFAVTGV